MSCSGCQTVVRGYQEIDRVFEIDEIGLVMDFVQNITSMSFERAVQIVKDHAAVSPQFYIVHPDVRDSMMGAAIVDLVRFLADKFEIKHVIVLSREKLDAVADASRTNVVFHMVKSPQTTETIVPLQRYDTPYLDFLLVYQVPSNYAFPAAYDVIETFGSTALIKVDGRY